MQTLHKLLFAASVGTLLAACDAKKREPEQSPNVTAAEKTASAPAPDTTLTDAEFANESAPKEADVPTPAIKRQFIRTADMTCQVRDVAKTTEQVETIATNAGGFVTKSGLDTDVNSTETVAVSADSSLETVRYTVKSTLTVRVPSAKLDTTLRAIAQFAEIIDHREISADDVGLQLLASEQTRRRNTAYDQRMRSAIDQRGRKGPNRLSETTTAEENRLTQQHATDEARINELGLTDQVRFSSITVALHQRPAIRRTMLANPASPHAYEPGFMAQAWEALVDGGYVLKAVALVLLRGWALLLAVFVAYRTYRWVKSGRLWA